MLAIPSIIVTPHGEHEFRDGILFSLPPELRDNYRIEQYLKITESGWTKSEFGYMALMRIDAQGNKYICPGLFLEGCDRPTKKFYGYSAKLTKKQVEQYLECHFDLLADTRNSSEGELTALVHDLRHLSSSIYHSAFAAKQAKSGAETQDLIETVIASQTMLRVRIDYLDFSNSVDRFGENEKIPVYSRVDKVIRCFRADARSKGIDIELTGGSYRLADGPNILDIVPYTLIENAIKYAPERTKIIVKVHDTDSATEVSVSSLGPAFVAAENGKIFDRGFRGENAVLARANGTGLGLSVAYNVMEIFKGQISAEQLGISELRGSIPYRQTNFHFSVPTSGEDGSRRTKFERLNRMRASRRLSSSRAKRN